MMLVIGINTRMIRKYKMEASWPMMMNGCSTGCPPIHVSVMRSATSMGIKIRIRMEATRANTPPSLLGIERRIA